MTERDTVPVARLRRRLLRLLAPGAVAEIIADVTSPDHDVRETCPTPDARERAAAAIARAQKKVG